MAVVLILCWCDLELGVDAGKARENTARSCGIFIFVATIVALK